LTEGPPLDERRPRRSVVRPYVLTHGRTRAAGAAVPLDAAVLALVEPLELAPGTTPEARTIVALCQEPIPLVELAARLDVPLGVARVLVGDLTAPGIVTIRPSRPGDAHTDVRLLERLLDGIRSI
jgi:hypothetical protein